MTSFLILGLIPLIIAFALVLSRFGKYVQPKNGAAAVANIQKINAAQSEYLNTPLRFGTLRELVDAGLVERSFLNTVSGYQLRIETQEDNYIILATALATGGRYDYYSFADGIVRYSSDSRKAPPGYSAAAVK